MWIRTRGPRFLLAPADEGGAGGGGGAQGGQGGDGQAGAGNGAQGQSGASGAAGGDAGGGGSGSGGADGGKPRGLLDIGGAANRSEAAKSGAGEAGAGAGADGKPAAGSEGDGKAGAGDGDKGPVAQLKPGERPDWLPEQFFNTDTGEVRLKEMAKSWGDMRSKVAKGHHEAPKDADSYKLELPEEGELTDKAKLVLHGDNPLKDDPILSAFREIAFEEGMSQGAFQKISERMIDAIHKQLPDFVEPEKELAKLGDSGLAKVKYLDDLNQKMVDRGIFDDKASAEFWATAATAGGAQMILALIQSFGGESIPSFEGRQAVGSPDAAALYAEQSKLLERSNKGENVETEWKALQKKFAAVFGEAPAGSSIPR